MPLDSRSVIRAYGAGLFPMADSADDPEIYWVRPRTRGLLPLDAFHIPRSLARTVRRRLFEIRIDYDFDGVVAGCAETTRKRAETWINPEIQRLYAELFQRGHGHSVECWQDGVLAGGLYGVSLGAAFFGESMFSRRRDASKVALVHLVARLNAGGYKLLDAQFVNNHLKQFGLRTLSHAAYAARLEPILNRSARFDALAPDADPATVLALAGNTRSETSSAGERRSG